MPDKKSDLSKTMRIDLIPEAPKTPVGGKKRIVVSQSRRIRPRAGDTCKIETADSRFNELFQNVYDAAIITDSKGAIVNANARAVEFLQYDRSELVGLSVLNVMSGADDSLLETLWDNLQNERFTLIQAYCVRKDGTFFPSEIAVNKLRLDEIHLCFFLRDITLRKQSEEMLMTEHNAIQNSANGIGMADLDMKLEYINPAMVRMWQSESVDDLLGADILGLLADKESGSDMIKAVMSDSQGWSGEMKAVRADGVEFDVQVSAVCNRNADGEVLGAVFSFMDISDRKRAEAAMREAERNRVMLESIGAACHHVGQPATVLLANLGLLQKKIGDTDEALAGLIAETIDTAENLGNVLHRLNAVNKYKTTQYIAPSEGHGGGANILDINRE